MLKRVGLVVVGLLVAFFAYVASRDGHFYYERSGVIKAPIDKVFPIVSNLKAGNLWSPWEQMDPNMKKTYNGPESDIGSSLEFEGNSDVGSGRLEILRVNRPNEVQMRLTMTKPFKSENMINYRLLADNDKTHFTWSMSGDGGFLGKLISVFVDCDKMVGAQMEKGIDNLKTLLEPKK